MSAEQIWDSLVALSIPNSDERKQNSKVIDLRLERFQQYQDQIESLDGEKLSRLARKGAKASKEINDEMEKIQKQLREAQEADVIEKLLLNSGEIMDELEINNARCLLSGYGSRI